MKKRRSLSTALVAGTLLFTAACARREEHGSSGPAAERPSVAVTSAAPATPATPESPPAGPPAPAAPSPTPGAGSGAPSTAATLAAIPSPVPVCPKTGLGEATLFWKAEGVTSVEIRVGAPDGKLFAKGGATGSAKTGAWVRKETVFFLIDASKGSPLAILQPDVVNGACP